MMEKKIDFPRDVAKGRRHRLISSAIILALVLQFIPIRVEPLRHISIPYLLQPIVQSLALSQTSQSSPELIWTPSLGPGIVQATGGLTITKIADPAYPTAVDQGGKIAYTFVISNNTGDNLDNVIITDTVPLNTDCDDVSDVSGWFPGLASCQDDRLVFWASGTTVLSDTDSLQFVYTVTVASPLTYPTVIANDDYGVTADRVGGGMSYSDYQTTPLTTPVNSPSWELQKRVTPTSTVQAGGSLTYTITFTNIGSLTTSGTYTIVDTIPNHTTVTDPGSGSSNGTTITWSSATPLTQNGSNAVQFTVQVESPLTNSLGITNQTYSIDGGGAVGPVFGLPVAVNVGSAPQLRVVKASNQNGEVGPGKNITYTITYSNAGNEIAGNFVVTDTIPVSTTLVYSSTPPDNQVNGRVFEWLGSNLSPAGGNQVITIAVRADLLLGHGAVLTNSVVISGNQGSFDSDTDVVTVDARPDLVVSKTDSRGGSPIRAAETLTYTIAYTNIGGGILNDLAITDTLPASVTLVSVDPGAATQVTTSPLVFTRSTLLIGQGGTITVVTTLDTAPWPSAGFAFANMVTGSVDPNEIETVNNVTGTTTTGQPGPPFTVTLNVPPRAGVGVNTAITATVTDQYGNPALDGTTVSLTIDSPGSVNPASPTTSNGMAVANINAGGPATVVISATSGAGSDSATVEFVRPQLAATKTAAPNPLFPGGILVYTVTVTNTGSIPAASVAFTDTLDSNLTFISANPTPDNVAGQDYVFDLGTIPDTGSNVRTIIITAMASPSLDDGNSITNNAVVDAPGTLTPLNFSALTTVTIPTLNKFVTPFSVRAGETLTYTIIYKNNSAGTINNLRLTDTLPAEVASIDPPLPGSATVVDGTPPTLVFTQSSLAANQRLTITVVGRVITGPWPATPVGITNQAVATHDTDPAGESIEITSQGRPNLAASINLIVAPTTVLIGDDSVITASITDQYGNLVLDGTTVNFTASLPGSSVTPNVLTQGGLATATVTANVSGTSVITAEAGSRTVTETVSFARPTLAVSKVGAPDPASPGGSLVYTILVENMGLVDALAVVLSDTLDSNLVFDDASMTYTQVVSDYGFALGTIPPGTNRSIIISTTTNSGLSNNDLITNTALVTAPDLLTTQSITEVTGISIFFLDKQVTPDPVLAGEMITYTITHRNDSSEFVGSLRITDTLPSTLTQIVTIDKGDAETVDIIPPTLIFTRSNLAIGVQTTITITGRVMTFPWPATPAGMTNVVTATAVLSSGGSVTRVDQAVSAGRPNVPQAISIDAPATATVGQTVPVTATITDQYGNFVLNGTVVTFTVSGGSSVVSPGSTTNGLASTTVSSTIVGTTVITVSSGSMSETAQFTVERLKIYLPLVLK